MSLKKTIILTFYLFVLWPVQSQNTIGLPDFVNYAKQVYKAGAQNRQIRQDRNGIMYFANSEGVLTFDGINWKLLPLPNKSIVRSIKFGPDNKLYVGGQDEFGYFSPSGNGQLTFHSLKSILPENERSFTDVWDIYFYHGWIFFQTSDRIYQVDGNKATSYQTSHWRYMTIYNDRLLAQDAEKGLLSFQNGTWSPFLKKSELNGEYYITSMTSVGNDSALVTTVKHGLYLLHSDEMTRFQNALPGKINNTHPSASLMVNDNHIAITTNLNGCLIIDKRGNLVQQFTTREGLQNNNILDIFLDKERNLWLGLDNGIDFIAYNNAIKHIYPDYLNEGSGYTAQVFKNDLYIGTSNGLYVARLNLEKDLSYVKSRFEPVANTKGQVWNLSEVNGLLLMGHHDGAFEIQNKVARPLDNSTGFWNFLPYSNVLPSTLVVAGNYQGVSFFDYANGIITKSKASAHFESSRFICIDGQDIWISHPYKGIYRVRLIGINSEIKRMAGKDGVLSKNGNYIFKIRNRIVLTTEQGIFEFNKSKDIFEPSAFFNQLFGSKVIRYFKEDFAGNIWFVFDKTIGVADMSTAQPTLIYFPELNNKFVSGFENVLPINRNNILIGAEKGFYHINYEEYKKIKSPIRVKIISVKAINKTDSLLFGGYESELNADSSESIKAAKVSHSWNSFHFEFASPVFAQQSNIEYSYLLQGFDEKFSEFSKKTEKEYTNLPAGKYVFKVKARNNLGNESSIKTYAFEVLPPWYQTIYAYIIYSLLFLGVMYLMYGALKKKFRHQQRKHEEEQKRLLYLHQLEIDKTEKEIISLKNEKLEAEIKHKNNELASVAMHLVQKGELLGKIKEQVVKLKKHSDGGKDVEDIKKIIRVLGDEDKIDTQWEQFTAHFDNVHSDFLSALKTTYPSLSNNELKLSAYLRMNLSTKEIAQLMNISVRGVEISRYRLRKKLEMPKEMNLYNFLVNIEMRNSRKI